MENSYVKPKNILTKVIIAVVAFVLLGAAFFAGYFTHRMSQKKELSSIEWALSIIENNYYYDYDGDLLEKTMSGLVSGLDEYSQYYTAEEYLALFADNAGEKSGIGISYNFINGEGARIISVVGNSPAFRAGVESGDTVIGAAAQNAEIDAASSTADELSDFFSQRAAGEEFSLILDDGKSVTVAKEEYSASYTAMYSNDTAWNFVTGADGAMGLVATSSERLGYLPDGTAYISLTQFYGDETPSQFAQLIGRFNAEGFTSLILDLRNNGGGYVTVMDEIAGCLAGSAGGRVSMTAKYKNGDEDNYYVSQREESCRLAEGTDLYVLANSGTASASEALIGVLVSYGALEYSDIFISDFGDEYLNWYKSYYPEGAKTARTYGKGIMQATYVNTTGEALKLTCAQIYWPNGKCIHGAGLSAEDGCTVVPNVRWTATKGDEELQSVLGIIGSR